MEITGLRAQRRDVVAEQTEVPHFAPAPRAAFAVEVQARVRAPQQHVPGSSPAPHKSPSRLTMTTGVNRRTSAAGSAQVIRTC